MRKHYVKVEEVKPNQTIKSLVKKIKKGRVKSESDRYILKFKALCEETNKILLKLKRKINSLKEEK